MSDPLSSIGAMHQTRKAILLTKYIGNQLSTMSTKNSDTEKHLNITVDKIGGLERSPIDDPVSEPFLGELRIFALERFDRLYGRICEGYDINHQWREQTKRHPYQQNCDGGGDVFSTDFEFFLEHVETLFEWRAVQEIVHFLNVLGPISFNFHHAPDLTKIN